MKITLPYPPTANLYWRMFRNRIVKSADARNYQKRVALIARGFRKLVGPVGIHVKAYRPRRIGDLDNTLKVVLDALRGIAYEDDKQIISIHADRYDDKANPRLEIELCELEATCSTQS